MSVPFPLRGNDTLRRTLTCGHLSHAVILSGAPGTGRTTLSGWLSQALVCSGTGTPPCGVCSDCVKAAAGYHPDVRIIENAAAMKVDEARDLCADAYIRPNEGKRKVYVFRNGGQMSEKVQNILLKLVEDGPDYAAFVFITEHADQLLLTIRSRCEELKLHPVSAAEAEEELAARMPKAEREELVRAAALSEGSIGAALLRLQKGDSADEEEARLLADRYCALLGRRDEAGLAVFMAEQEKRTRQELLPFCHLCRRQAHEAMLYQVGAAGGASNPLTALERSRLLKLTEVFQEAARRLEGNGGVGHCLGWLTVSCADVILG